MRNSHLPHRQRSEDSLRVVSRRFLKRPPLPKTASLVEGSLRAVLDCHSEFLPDVKSCHCRTGCTRMGASSTPLGKLDSRPRTSEECSRCLAQREVRRVSPSRFLPFSLQVVLLRFKKCVPPPLIGGF